MNVAHHMSCRGFAETSIHFCFGKFLALIAPKNSKGHANFFREKFGITFAIFGGDMSAGNLAK
jgi:hypothetical protein